MTKAQEILNIVAAFDTGGVDNIRLSKRLSDDEMSKLLKDLKSDTGVSASPLRGSNNGQVLVDMKDWQKAIDYLRAKGMTDENH